jgi:hypothetical protein
MPQSIALREEGQPVGPLVAEGFAFLSGTLDQALAYWHEIRGDSACPRRDALQPERIVSLWPHILMVDVIDDGSDYFIRLFGQRLVDTYGEHTGRKLSEAKVPDLVRDRSRQLFDFCRAKAAPTYAYWQETAPRRGHAVNVESLCLPLSSDGTAVDRMMSLNVNTRCEN